MPQRRHEQLARQLEKGGVEAALDDTGKLDELDDLVQKADVLHQAAPYRRRRSLECFGQPIATDLRVDDDVRRRKRLHVGIRMGDLHRPGTVEPMTRGAVPGRHAEQGHRQHLAAVQRQQPVDRPDPARPAVAPAHRLGEGHLGDRCRKLRAQQLTQRLARDLTTEADVAPALRLLQAQLRGLDPLLLGEAQRGRRRLAVGREGDAGRRPQHELLAVRLPRLDLLDAHREASRSAPAPIGSVLQIGLVQDLHETPPQILRRLTDHARGDLLAADLDQKRGGSGHRAACPATSNGKPSASRFAR